MQGRKRSYTDEQKAEMSALLIKGMSPISVSQAMRLSIHIVYQVDRQLGTKHVREALKLAASEVKP